MNMPIRNRYRTTTTRSITVWDGGAGISHNRCGESGGDADKEGYIPAAATSATRARFIRKGEQGRCEAISFVTGHCTRP